MANTYRNLRNKHQKQFNEFPIIFAFNDAQLHKGMAELGVEDIKELVLVTFNGLIRKSDREQFQKLMDGFEAELKDHIDKDETGEGFVFEMFYDELANHEFVISGELEPTLDALGLSIEEVKSNEKLLHGLNLAKEKYFENVNL